MRVLLVTRANAAAKPGGDAVVAERAAEALRGLGVEADFVASDEPDARGYDVAHVFGIFDPHVARAQFAAVRRAGVPLVLSPIWWDRSGFFAISPRVERILTERDPRRIDSALARLRADEPRIVRRPGRGAERRLREQAELMRACDVAVTASEVEAFVCATQLRAQHVPYVVARYGVDSEYFDVPRSAVRSGVVCVGRIEPLKNQALLLHALRDVDADVTLVGRAYEDAYIALCRRRANRRTRFVERLARAELQALLARSAVHVLPSFGDLPGLVSLEAAALGARVVAGGRGSEREYLGPHADYVDPLEPDAIRDAVQRALTRGARSAGDALDIRLRALTWHGHAETLREAYALAVR
ncbi:MAG TPA: glycosyltransferase family 4 protein [Candidatus Baltobacteraceae bacterium]|nr:glycosyltransferase family 4 protein [Candidatus Baltobacteraceae bacterium]